MGCILIFSYFVLPLVSQKKCKFLFALCGLKASLLAKIDSYERSPTGVFVVKNKTLLKVSWE